MSKMFLAPFVCVLSSLAFAQVAVPIEAEFALVEKAAAKAIAKRNLADFAKLIDDEAVFYHMGQTAKGKAAVVEFARPMFDAPTAPYIFATGEVNVLPSGLAMTSGPIRLPNGRTVAHYNTVWRKGPAGWKILFDRSWPSSQ